MWPPRFAELMDRTENCPKFKLFCKFSGRFQFLTQSSPFETIPIGRADVFRASTRHGVLVGGAGRTFGEMQELRPRLMGLKHKTPHFRSAGAKFTDVSRVIEDSRLRYSQSYGACFEGSVVRRSLANMHESARIGLARLSHTGAHTTFKVAISRHCSSLSGLSRLGRRSPASTSETIGPRERPETEVPLPPFKTLLGKILGGSAQATPNQRCRYRP